MIFILWSKQKILICRLLTFLTFCENLIKKFTSKNMSFLYISNTRVPVFFSSWFQVYLNDYANIIKGDMNILYCKKCVWDWKQDLGFEIRKLFCVSGGKLLLQKRIISLTTMLKTLCSIQFVGRITTDMVFRFQFDSKLES